MIVSLAVAALVAIQDGDSLMARGVSRELARYRAAHIRDVRYDLTLDVTRRDAAEGDVRVSFTRINGGDVYLDFRGDEFSNVIVNDVPMEAVEYNRAHMRFEAQFLRNGRNVITARFKSPIAPSGAAIIRFTDDTDKRDYLYTLLVPSDANLLFPCFDQPDLKAVFGLTLITPAKWSALANSSITEHTEHADSKVFRFARTKRIPTYLFAFAAGPYMQLRDAKKDITLWVRASRAREVEKDTLIALNRRARAWMSSYFGVPYPFEKLDFLLAPAFPFGGMEHPGAIFYNEESFIFREPPTLNQRLGRQATVNHEVAHQWFGDYTTMKWFDDLWLKEGFATYMAAKMQAATGDSTAWMSFYLRSKPAAYDVDASAGTTPVWQELANLDQAKSNYGAIVYNKAPGVLKQLNHLVGETAFKKGVHDFLVTHAYGNATWQELLASIGKVAGRDLTEWGRAYFLRPGMPIVEQRIIPDRRYGLGARRITQLLLIQHPAQPVSGPGFWPMKVDVLLYYGRDSSVTLPVEMQSETTFVRNAEGLPPPAFVYANANDYGYGLFMLDCGVLGPEIIRLRTCSTDWLLNNDVDFKDPFLRAMVWGSLWDAVRDARLAPFDYISAARPALTYERDEQIASRLMGRIVRAIDSYLTKPDASSGLMRSERGYAELAFFDGARHPSNAYGLRKNFLDSFISVAGTPDALERLDAWLDTTSAAGMPLRQPTRWSIVTALIARGAPSAEARLAAETARDTTTGGKRRAFIAGAAFPRPETKRAYFDRYFKDSTLNEDWVTASLGAFNFSEQAELTLPYLRPALDTLPWIQKNRRIFFLGSWLNAFIGGQRSPEALAVVDRYLGEHPDLPRDLRQKVLQARDDLERTVRIRGKILQ